MPRVQPFTNYPPVKRTPWSLAGIWNGLRVESEGFHSYQLAKAGLKIKLEAMVRLLAAGLLLGLLSSSGCIQEQWRGFVYPTRDNLIDYRDLGEFDSLEECRDHTVAWLEDRNLLGVGDYECGLNCELSDSGIIYVCEETTR